MGAPLARYTLRATPSARPSFAGDNSVSDMVGGCLGMLGMNGHRHSISSLAGCLPALEPQGETPKANPAPMVEQVRAAIERAADSPPRPNVAQAQKNNALSPSLQPKSRMCGPQVRFCERGPGQPGPLLCEPAAPR